MRSLKEGLIGGAIAAGIVLGGPALLRKAMEYTHPPEEWLELRSFRVADTEVGLPPTTTVDREVKDTIIGDWLVTLWWRNADGTFTSVCRRQFKRELIEEARLPNPTPLTYWLGSPPEDDCNYSLIGEYMVTIWVTITTEDGRPVTPISLRSNTFRILPDRGVSP